MKAGAAGRALQVAALLVVTACAQLERAAPEQPVFELAGRLAARQGEEAFSGNIAWRHGADADEMLITTPIGQGVARIVRDRNGVVLTTAEPKEYRGPDAESISEQALGYRLPLQGLADAVRGLPATELEKRGWKVEILERDAEGRPRRLRLSYPGVDLRLAISEWK
ncbi:MAG: outer membrane lipoprotein LolB [Betaproteobacteria bacterium]|nr:outer membrane lipoprotein LolB [Betaproteobacteria bacterium]